jgi:aspartate/methionine/tyrosine aminotransferase
MAAPVGDGVTLDRWFAQQGAPLAFDLARSGAVSLSLAEVLDRTGTPPADILDVSLDYGAGRGSERLIAAVRACLGGDAPIEVVVASGAVEALLLLTLASASAGDVLVGTPAYGALVNAPRAAGRRVRTVPVWSPVGGLRLDALAAQVTDSTGLVVVNTPHNPTGACLLLAELDAFAEHCADHGALLVVDEVARGTLDPTAVSAARCRGFAEGRIAVVGDVSKSLGLGGLRIGWLATADAQLADRVATAKDSTTVSSGTLSERIAAIALESSEPLLAPVRAAARANLATLRRVLVSTGDEERWAPPDDGLVAFPALSTVSGVDRLVAALRSRQVGVVPGWVFGEPDRIRIGLGARPSHFAEAMIRLCDALSR